MSNYPETPKSKVVLEPGEQFCPECEGGTKSLYYCSRCSGTGKLDWIQAAVIKEPKAAIGGSHLVFDADVNSLYPTNISINGNAIIQGELDCNTISDLTMDLIKRNMEQYIKDEVDKRVEERLKEMVVDDFLNPGGNVK